MRIGVPREVKSDERRVAITPAAVQELVRRGHSVMIEHDAGMGSAIADADYVAAGAVIAEKVDDVWDFAELVVKVKEPIEQEFAQLRENQVLFTFLHLAANRACTDALMAAGTTAIAYETVQRPDGTLPLLAPMSEVAGRLAAHVGSCLLMSNAGGRGVLMGGVPGTSPARVVILGAGVSGSSAAAMTIGMHADTLIIDQNLQRLRQLDAIYQGRCRTLAANTYEIERAVTEADLVIGAVLQPGAKAPQLVSNDLVARMKSGSVLVDISVDQGGCFEDTRPTTHTDPTFTVHNSLFYCVTNMPGAVPRTSTYALVNAVLPYLVSIADKGWRKAVQDHKDLALGVNVHRGHLTNAQVAAAHDLPVTSLTDLLSAEA